MSSYYPRTFLSFLLFFSFLFLFISKGIAQTVTLPLTLDERVLTSLIKDSSFTGPEDSIDVAGQDGQCFHVRLKDPRYSIEDNLLRLEIELNIKTGKTVGQRCLFPVEWNGFIVLWQQPVFSGEGFGLSFQVVDSLLLNKKREKALLAGIAWDVVKEDVYYHINQISVDLAPPVEHLKGFLRTLFNREVEQQISDMLNSFRKGATYLDENNLIVELEADVHEVYTPKSEYQLLTDEEREEIVALWERWDSFLVYLLSEMSQDTLDDEDRQLLMDSLLESRYGFSEALNNQNLKGDLVRQQFLHTWEILSPLFRKQLFKTHSENSLGFLAFFSAIDALKVFDDLGPTFGIELSQEGLLHLARLLSGEDADLPYKPEVDDTLRRLFDLGPDQGDKYHDQEIKEFDLMDNTGGDPLRFLYNIIIPSAYADVDTGMPSFSEIIEWKVPKEPYPDYVNRVRQVLENATLKVVDEGEIPESIEKTYKDMIPAFAWQESCFRQFVVKKSKFTYLLSYNGSSVGLMQINERIWRGLYDRQRLRWDIHYNAIAGCEILALYLNKYVLRDTSWLTAEKPQLLSRLLYSMYNGGPGQYKKFLEREKTGKHYKSDSLFAEKLEWTTNAEWDKIRFCLVGG